MGILSSAFTLFLRPFMPKLMTLGEYCKLGRVSWHQLAYVSWNSRIYLGQSLICDLRKKLATISILKQIVINYNMNHAVDLMRFKYVKWVKISEVFGVGVLWLVEKWLSACSRHVAAQILTLASREMHNYNHKIIPQTLLTELQQLLFKIFIWN